MLKLLGLLFWGVILIACFPKPKRKRNKVMEFDLPKDDKVEEKPQEKLTDKEIEDKIEESLAFKQIEEKSKLEGQDDNKDQAIYSISLGKITEGSTLENEAMIININNYIHTDGFDTNSRITQDVPIPGERQFILQTLIQSDTADGVEIVKNNAVEAFVKYKGTKIKKCKSIVKRNKGLGYIFPFMKDIVNFVVYLPEEALDNLDDIKLVLYFNKKQYLYQGRPNDYKLLNDFAYEIREIGKNLPDKLEDLEKAFEIIRKFYNEALDGQSYDKKVFDKALERLKAECKKYNQCKTEFIENAKGKITKTTMTRMMNSVAYYTDIVDICNEINDYKDLFDKYEKLMEASRDRDKGREDGEYIELITKEARS